MRAFYSPVRLSSVLLLAGTLGLRNPFTFAVQAETGRIFINEGVAGANYGIRLQPPARARCRRVIQ
jgi:hypothetical protein